MLRILQTIEHDNQLRPSKLHIIKAPNSARGGEYRQVVAFCGFSNRILNRWHKHWRTNIGRHSKVKFKSVTEEDLQSNAEARKRLIEVAGVKEADKLVPAPEVTEHESVWKFFESIGYDYNNRSTKHLDSFVVFTECASR